MNATDNADSLAVSLQLEMNKMRQQSITSELLDIAGGSEALRTNK
jgi:F-type H+-transporting ATPase subunit gamma